LSDFKYKAFISYSHRDEKITQWLHRRLEQYRIPRYLVKQNQLPSNRLKPIFRDRDELSSSPSLGKSIEAALRDSEALIVICSPASAKSKWVNEEIATYQRLGRGDQIYCLIVEGDPSNAFPPALSSGEPMASDLSHDGKLNAFLKIAAGLLEVPFDKLRQREQQARNRRLVVISGLSFAGMVFAVGLASFAMISREQAIVAREEADQQRLVAERAEVQATQEAETARRISDVMVGIFKVSDPSEARGNTITARELLEVGAEDIQRELAGQPVIQATLNHTIGDVFLSLGLYQRSRPLLNLALDARLSALGDDNPEVATTLMRLAQLERDTGNFALARSYYEEALQIREQALGPYDLAVAETLNDLAALIWATGNYDESLKLYDRVLQIREQSLGENNPELAATLNGIASVAWGGGDYVKAMELFSRVLDIRRLALGTDHPDVAKALSNVAASLFMQGEFGEARPLYEEALAIQEKVLGPDHLDLVLSLSNLAEDLVELGDYATAQSLYERAVAIGEAAVGPEHPMLGWPLDGLGTVHHRASDFAASRREFERALSIRETALGSEHTDVADTLEGYGAMLQSAGENAEAESLLSRAASIRELAAAAANSADR
jgi:tetratricopeptide (TPR) repeat protein